MSANRPGNSLRKALAVGFAFETTLRDRIGANNRNDFFSFRVNNARSFFRARLIDPRQSVGFNLLNSSGQILQTSTRTGARSQAVQSNLDPGEYYIQIFSTSPRSKPYQLKLFKDEILCGCGDTDQPSRSRSTQAQSLFT